MKQRLLYFSPGLSGGIIEYARNQANALGLAGVDVQFLASNGYQALMGDNYQLLPRLKHPQGGRKGSRVLARFETARCILANLCELARYVKESGCRYVLLSSYAEYLAPLWACKMRKLMRCGVVFGAVVHDPVRDAVIGPYWWHRWSVAEGYSFLREAFLHESVELDTGRPLPRMRTTVIPHGIYKPSPPRKSAEQIRRELDLPPNARVALAFGHIRDNKNLDLVLHAMAKVPDFFLVVAGNGMVPRQRSIAYYQQLATDLGVAHRCRWREAYIPESEIAEYFAGADIVMLTYSRSFRSASGVLNLAVGCRKPCIASSGEGNLRKTVLDYGLGIWVEPDSVEALVAGFRRCLSEPPSPDWVRYEREQGWHKNAELVILRMFDS